MFLNVFSFLFFFHHFSSAFFTFIMVLSKVIGLYEHTLSKLGKCHCTLYVLADWENVKAQFVMYVCVSVHNGICDFPEDSVD